MALLDHLVPRCPAPGLATLVRGRYRPLTLPEVADLIPDRTPPSAEPCTDLCRWGDDPNSEHLRLIRQAIGPAVHVLDVWKMRQWLGRPIVVVARNDIMHCHHPRYDDDPDDDLDDDLDYLTNTRQYTLDALEVIVPQRIGRGQKREDGLVVVGRRLRVKDATAEAWASFLEPYSPERKGPPYNQEWLTFEWPVHTDGKMEGAYPSGYPKGGYNALVFAEFLREENLP